MRFDKVIIENAKSYDLDNIQAITEKIFSALPATKRLNPDTKVAIKPNLVAKHGPDAAVTTHPTVVEAVIIALKARGVKDITVIDSAGGIYNEQVMNSIYKISGLQDVCERQGVRYGGDYESSTRRVEGIRCKEFIVTNPINNADFIINMPKLKTHAMMSLTCGVKNLFGVIPGLKKAELHMRFPDRQMFGEMICDLCELIRPDITIVDAVVGMEGDGPSGGDPRPIGSIIAGENIYNVDIVCAKYIAVNPDDVPYLVSAKNRGLCGVFSNDMLQYPDKFNPIKDFKKPSTQKSIIFANRLPKPLRFIMPYVAELITPRPVVNRKGCVGCSKCAEICPKDIIDINNKKAYINKKSCIRCYCCHEMCPVKAIDIKTMGVFNA